MSFLSNLFFFVVCFCGLSPPPLFELRRAPSFARLPLLLLSSLRLAIRSSAAAERRMVEVGGVEPPSETALAKRLRVYQTFSLAQSMPICGLIPAQTPDCTACGVQTPNFARGPAELCRTSHSRRLRADIGAVLLRPRERNRCSQLLCFPFFNEANGVLDAQSGLHASRRNRITPTRGKLVAGAGFEPTAFRL